MHRLTSAHIQARRLPINQHHPYVRPHTVQELVLAIRLPLEIASRRSLCNIVERVAQEHGICVHDKHIVAVAHNGLDNRRFDAHDLLPCLLRVLSLRAEFHVVPVQQ